ncbi:hypothetical protein [Pelovirga terrestris]|uniref:DUF4398 domain-containing protein n=1 Tax=Pelovirga terrestris TaxID=2771352 RepID=A0A8J6UR75_9BACT|nr:hypothetical protein [Pelovirga terrestris]MBD1400741.1 hypothetical protein [Pelovirga terrestris]
MKTTTYQWFIVLLTITLLIAGCGGPKLKVEPIPVPANPTEEAGKLEADITRARQQQVNILSPTWFARAEASHKEAARLIAAKGEIGQISNHLAQGYAELAQAQEISKLAQTEATKKTEQERLAAEKQATEEKLAAERRFNELYNQVQAMFSKDEAESYKQGQQMVIRLRGMSFPIGQSMIMPENYPLIITY